MSIIEGTPTTGRRVVTLTLDERHKLSEVALVMAACTSRDLGTVGDDPQEYIAEAAVIAHRAAFLQDAAGGRLWIDEAMLSTLDEVIVHQRHELAHCERWYAESKQPGALDAGAITAADCEAQRAALVMFEGIRARVVSQIGDTEVSTFVDSVGEAAALHGTSLASLKANWRLRIGTLAALGAGDVGEDLSGSDQPEDLLARVGELEAWADLARWTTVPGTPVTDGALWALGVLRADHDADAEAERHRPGAHSGDIAVSGAYVEMIDHVMTMADGTVS